MSNILREKIAAELMRGWVAIPSDPERIADRILAIPEMAEALERSDDESWIHVSPEERAMLQSAKNLELRELLTRSASPPA